MSITGLPFLSLLVVLTAGLTTGTYLAWPRWPQPVALPARLLTLVLLMAAGTLLSLDQINRTYDFYSSFTDLVSSPPNAHALAVADAPKPGAGVTVLTPAWAARGREAARHGQGVLLHVTYRGTRSRITRDGDLYLPAAYFLDPGNRRFGAIEFFHGVPGSPDQFQRLLGISHRLDQEIAAGRIPPVVGVFPRIFAGPVAECVNPAKGEQDATYLALDVQEDVLSSFRVLPGRSWAAIGVSTGGFCAVNLGLHYPGRYAAAASLSGYFTAGEEPGSAYLYRGSRSARHENSPLWWVRHRAPTAPALYAFASGGDPSAVREVRALQRTVRSHARALPLDTSLALRGGHNWTVWAGAMNPALDWLASYLPAPLAPPLTEAGTIR